MLPGQLVLLCFDQPRACVAVVLTGRALCPNVIERRKVKLILYTIARRTNGHCAGKRLRQQDDIFRYSGFGSAVCRAHHSPSFGLTSVGHPFLQGPIDSRRFKSHCGTSLLWDCPRNIFNFSFGILYKRESVSYKSNVRYEFCSRTDPGQEWRNRTVAHEQLDV